MLVGSAVHFNPDVRKDIHSLVGYQVFLSLFGRLLASGAKQKRLDGVGGHYRHS